MNGIYPGKRIVSYQKRILSYCQLHNIKFDKHFGDEEVTKIAVIDWSIEQRPLLLKETFNREIDVYRFLKEKNKHPGNYQVLNFKTGKEYSLEMSEKPTILGTFDNQKDTDFIYDDKA